MHFPLFMIDLDTLSLMSTEERRTHFLEGLDYFEGSSIEYENMKGKSYKIIDADNDGQKGVLYDLNQSMFIESMLRVRRRKKGNTEKSVRDEQGELIDRLIEEKCVAMIECEHLNSDYFLGMMARGAYYMTGYFVKEK